jgi:hypothetical protein
VANAAWLGEIIRPPSRDIRSLNQRQRHLAGDIRLSGALP